MAKQVDEIAAMRALVEKERHGVLSTAHSKHGGWPFGSVTPYALTADGDPILLLSDLAEHTHNLRADPRASLLVQDASGRDSPQAAARVTLLGRASIPEGDEGEAAKTAYLARFPEAKGHFGAHAFFIHVLRVERVRWIAGFGTMGWLDRAGWAPPSAAGEGADPLAPHAQGICDHMNGDHAAALLELAAHAAGVKGSVARMTGIDARGIDVDVTPSKGRAKRVRIPFAEPISSPEAVRKTLIAMLAKARRGR